jgi:hypothetical protein
MHPILLTGVALVGLPILLHLIMRQEPKRQPLPTFRFLKLKQKINDRKIRLRHWLLLAMRMLLIALICLALFQPRLLSNRFNIRGEQPVAAVIVLDTSPSMGYEVANRAGLSPARQRGLRLLEETAQGPWTMLDDARFRALELIEELPPNSKVAIVECAERLADWSPTAFDARKKIQAIRKTRGNAQPVSRSVEQAYQLFEKLETTADGEGPMPRLLVVLSDRTAPSWDGERSKGLEDLKAKMQPEVLPLYLDFGTEKPANLAIVEAGTETPTLSAGDDALIRVTIQATGPATENIVVCRFDGENEAEKKQVKLAAGESTALEFRRMGLKAGLHSAEISLVTADALPFDNIRYVALRVREPRRILAIADGPPGYGMLGGGVLQMARANLRTDPFRDALASYRGFFAELHRTDEVANWTAEAWAPYEAVALCGVSNPNDLWAPLQAYLERGGQVLVFPGGPQDMDLKTYDNASALALLPGKYQAFLERPKLEVGWAWEALDYQRPLLAPFAEWRKEPQIDFVKFPPMLRKYWQIEPQNRQSVLVPLTDGATPETQNPAILERRIGANGRVLQFAMTFDERRDPVTFEPWTDYNEAKSFQLVLSILAVRYLVGETLATATNYFTGQTVAVKWPTEAPANVRYFLNGPGIPETDAIKTRDPKEAYFRLPGDKTTTPGIYTLTSEDKRFADIFSLNIAPAESTLERQSLEQLEPHFGKEGVATADKELKLREILKGTFNQPVELFPFLMILLLLFMALENLLANRFYKSK